MARKLLTPSLRSKSAAAKIAAAEKYLSSPGMQHNPAYCGGGMMQPARPYKSRVAHILLWLSLGFLGAHNFYIGRWARGLLELFYFPIAFFALCSASNLPSAHFELIFSLLGCGYPILLLFDVIFVNTDGEGRPLA